MINPHLKSAVEADQLAKRRILIELGRGLPFLRRQARTERRARLWCYFNLAMCGACLALPWPGYEIIHGLAMAALGCFWVYLADKSKKNTKRIELAISDTEALLKKHGIGVR